MKIGELAQRSGLSVDTLRYYERIGLLPRPPRDGGGQRRYDAAMLGWIEFIGRLKATGMPLAEMCQYAALRAAGPDTQGARQALLAAHREKVRAQVALLQGSLAVLDAKIELYGAAVQATAPEEDKRA